MSTFAEGPADRSVAAPTKLDDDAQVKDEAASHNALFWIQKALVEYFYLYDEAYGRLHGISQDEIDMVLVEQAKELGPRSQGKKLDDLQRFNEIMDHFQGGSNRTLYFKMSELLTTCAGARRRVSEAISFRLSHQSNVILGSPSCDLSAHVDTSTGRPIKYSIYQFPIHQFDYHDTDWQFTLGTFGVMWEPLPGAKPRAVMGPLCTSSRGDNWIDDGTLALTQNSSRKIVICAANQRPTRAKVWGSKVWRWHAGTDRTSERVHQAAYRLVQSGRLHNFWVIAEPCVVDIETGWPVLQSG